jgi:DNA-binding XRE family transcriptional regulator
MKLNSQQVREKLQEIDRSITWLAKQIGVSPQTMHNQIENKTVKNADKIAKVLKVGLTTLLIKEPIDKDT